MKLQFRILMFIVCLNLATGLAIALALPGTEYVQATVPEDMGDYEEHFNATEIANKWSANPLSGIPVIGDIFSGFYFLWQNIEYLLDGFPMLLTWIGDTYITDASAQTSFQIIAMALRAVYAILMSVVLVEFISGRYFTD